MSTDPFNPFAPPEDQSMAVENADSAGDVRATRVNRLGAAILDGIIIACITVPIQFMSGFIQRAQQQQVSMVETFAMNFLGVLVMAALNGYTLATRGQTLGKMAAGIQIVDHETGRLLPFLRVFVIRSLWTLPLSFIVAIIPGQMDDIVISVAVLIDVLLIFGSDQRCLHDYLAGSKVVNYSANRARLS